MNSQKILTIVVAAISILGAILWILIARGGEQGPIGGMMTLGMVLVGAAAVFSFVFSLLNIVSSPSKLKKTLTSVGAFAIVAIVCYAIAQGVAVEGEEMSITESGSKLVGAGLNLFYALIVIAFSIMIFFGVKRTFLK